MMAMGKVEKKMQANTGNYWQKYISKKANEFVVCFE